MSNHISHLKVQQFFLFGGLHGNAYNRNQFYIEMLMIQNITFPLEHPINAVDSYKIPDLLAFS
jgi:hypothetical protein